MLKLFAGCTALFSIIGFSSAAIAHSSAIPHNHTEVALFSAQYWMLGIIALGFAGLAIMVKLRKSR